MNIPLLQDERIIIKGVATAQKKYVKNMLRKESTLRENSVLGELVLTNQRLLLVDYTYNRKLNILINLSEISKCGGTFYKLVVTNKHEQHEFIITSTDKWLVELNKLIKVPAIQVR